MTGIFNIQKDKTFSQILSDLLNPKNINFNTDLTLEQIKILCQDRYFQLVYDNNQLPIGKRRSLNEIWLEVMQEYKELKVSLDRQSRKEVTQTIKRSPLVDAIKGIT